MVLIERVNWSVLDRDVLVQQRNREVFSPAISLFRWWARRPHAVAGSLLDAAIKVFGDDSFVVSDPFSGGGTVAFEAARRGLSVYAQDLYPWPSMGLATSLNRADVDEFRLARVLLTNQLQPLRALYQRKDHDQPCEVTHIVRVRVAECLHCQSDIFLFRDPLVSVASRSIDENRAFYGCSACGAVTSRERGIQSYSCAACKIRWALNEPAGFLQNSTIVCPHCLKESLLLDFLSEAPRWHPVLIS